MVGHQGLVNAHPMYNVNHGLRAEAFCAPVFKLPANVPISSDPLTMSASVSTPVVRYRVSTSMAFSAISLQALTIPLRSASILVPWVFSQSWLCFKIPCLSLFAPSQPEWHVLSAWIATLVCSICCLDSSCMGVGTSAGPVCPDELGPVLPDAAEDAVGRSALSKSGSNFSKSWSCSWRVTVSSFPSLICFLDQVSWTNCNSKL